MCSYYADQLALNERDHDQKDALRIFSDFGIELHLEKVESIDEHGIYGNQGLFSSNPNGLAEYLKNKGLDVRTITTGDCTGVILRDPDGNVLTVTEDPEDVG